MLNTQALPHVLAQIHKRYCSMFFSKLVLFENSDNESQGENVRHYDMECQAVETIAAILHTKIKAVQFKVFDQLQSFDEKTFYLPQKMPKQYPINYSMTPRATNNMRNMKPFASMKHLLDSSDNEHNRMTASHCQRSSDLDSTLSQIMNRVKNLNLRLSKRNHTSKAQDPEADCPFGKEEKRRMVMGKINKIETEITEIIGEDDHPQSASTNLSKSSDLKPGSHIIQQPKKRVVGL